MYLFNHWACRKGFSHESNAFWTRVFLLPVITFARLKYKWIDKIVKIKTIIRLRVIGQDDIFPGVLLRAVEYQKSKYHIHPPRRVIK